MAFLVALGGKKKSSLILQLKKTHYIGKVTYNFGTNIFV